MRSTTRAAVVATALLATLTATGPASAAKPGISQAGHGTWTAASAGVTFTGTTTGTPLSGTTTGSISAVDGTLPPWGGCEPGTGTLTTSDGKDTLTVTLRGDICTAVAPTGHLVFVGWYDVTSYTGAKGKKAYDGVGGVDIRPLADGTVGWLLSGGLR